LKTKRLKKRVSNVQKLCVCVCVCVCVCIKCQKCNIKLISLKEKKSQDLLH